MSDPADNLIARSYRQRLQAGPGQPPRFVVVDCESTGTDAARDSIISIGAVAVVEDCIRVDDSFETLVRISHNTASVFIHGITAEAASDSGIEESVALEVFLDYLGGAIIVGHHVGYDIDILSHAAQKHFGIGIDNPRVDTMELAMKLAEAGALGFELSPGQFGLDALCAILGIEPHDRHTAAGDAYITAQIFLRLLKAARRAHLDSVDFLTAAYKVEEN